MHSYCKILFFCRILISWFPYVENLLHFDLADFWVNFIKQFVFCFFCCLYHFYIEIPVLLLFILHIYQEYCISYHGSVDILCSKVMVMGNSKILRVFNFTQIAKISCSWNIHVLQYVSASCADFWLRGQLPHGVGTYVHSLLADGQVFSFLSFLLRVYD